MDPGDELRLREIKREYLDFLDDDVIYLYEIKIETIYTAIFIKLTARSRILQWKGKRHDYRKPSSTNREHKRFA